MDGDIHLTTAMQITQKPAHAIQKEERKKAKGVNFGFVFGMGWRKFVDYARDSYDVVVSDSEAQEFRKRFFETYSRLPAWHERQRRLVRNYHRVQSAIGRVRHLPDIDSGDEEVRKEAERQAINSPVQSLASDMMLLAMIILHAMMDPTEARIVGTVHDSLMFEIREDRVWYWVPIIKDTMEHLPLKKKFGVDLSVPIKADITVGEHWGEGREYEAPTDMGTDDTLRQDLVGKHRVS
jgi:DNA polymerase-1